MSACLKKKRFIGFGRVETVNSYESVNIIPKNRRSSLRFPASAYFHIFRIPKFPNRRAHTECVLLNLLTMKNYSPFPFYTPLAILLCCLLLNTDNLMAQPSVDNALATIDTENNNMISAPFAPVKYDYETVPGDPIGVKIYTMSNGMKIYMSVNKDEPRIQTNIAVRAGSKHDPAETTGLAHYLEHMMFKGTRNIGALNADEEQVKLQKISDLYEQHRAETDPDKRKAIYAEIDKVSGEAAQLVAANEYDKMVSSLGAKGTNAYTWVEQTVYVNDIPSNELGRWLELESERFREVVLRLFHTELEAVYEEFNINQDRDFRKVSAAMNAALYPTHPYGTQTTIGKGEHLKNPSHVKIQEYFRTYYVPNNMAIILSGDFDPDDAVAKAEKTFGKYESKPVPEFTFETQPEIKETVRKEVFGQEAEYVELGWRFAGAGSDDVAKLNLLRGILYNRQAGLMDLNLMQKQAVLSASAGVQTFEDFSKFSMTGKPREGQKLEDVEQLLLSELEKVKKGDFPGWLPGAVIKDMKLGEIRSNESNGARAYFMTTAFILGLEWEEYVNRFKNMEKLSKDDIVRFANERFGDNYVAVYKRTGEDTSQTKVDKPAITPIDLNREEQSEFTKAFLAKEAPRMQPDFIDYEEKIAKKDLSSGVPLDYVKNKANPTFSMNYILETGKRHDKVLPLAITLLPYLGTDKYTPEQLQQEFFKLGLSFDVYAGDERMYVTLSGLDESYEEGVKLFEHILANVKADAEAWEKVVDDIMVKRANSMKDKRTILRRGMASYAKYGDDNPFNDIMTESELRSQDPAVLQEKLRGLTDYEHRIYYYGPREIGKVAEVLEKNHRVPAQLKPIEKGKQYAEVPQTENTVLFVDFPMVQAEFMMMSKGSEKFDKEEYIMSELFNNYFGFGLSSIVFQEIRESKALAYSAYAYSAAPQKEDKAHYFQAYVGTQADKLPDAVPAMREIIETMPYSEEQIKQAVNSIRKKIETDRVSDRSVYWNYRSAADRGLDYDIRREVYERMQTVTPEELRQFQEEKIKNRNYTYLVLGSKDNVDMEYLKSLGKVRELTLEEVFGTEIKP